MAIDVKNAEKELKNYLEGLSERDPHFWSFKENDARTYVHNFFQYPAMMVPQMQGTLIDAVKEIFGIKSIIDPFVGSGTTMTEAMTRGLNFHGIDINPLAILICKTKSQVFECNLIETKSQELFRVIDRDKCESIEIKFGNLYKWFQKDIAEQLSVIRRAILQESDIDIRRFFWVALAETIRLSSNSRTSNFKLYIMTPEAIANRSINAIQLFKQIISSNIKNLIQYKEFLDEKNLIKDGTYRQNIRIDLGDAKIAKNASNEELADMLITSPPYGDNKTTVAYGQYSYLPLQWIELTDIDPGIDPDYLSTTMEIDSRSLGGLLANAIDNSRYLRDMSPSFCNLMEELEATEPADRSKRVAAFCYDLDQTLDPILGYLKLDSFLIWTVGNRRVGGREVPTDKILEELLKFRGVELLVKLQREFPSNAKRMNNITNTMKSEQILVMRRGSSHNGE